jgi:hypothetical protein
MRYFILYFSLLFGFLSLSSQSIAFDLFDQNRGKEPASDKPTPVISKPKNKPKAKPKPKRKPKPKKKAPIPKQLDFVLKGVSRLGQNFYVSLYTPNKKDISLTWKKGQSLPIAGHSDYHLKAVRAREVEISYPKKAPCRENRQGNGILCKTNQLALVSLLRGKPTAAKSTGSMRRKAVQKEKSTAIKRVKANITPSQAERHFTNMQKKSSIRAADVPEGMKVVKTPFGERLVKR